MCNTGYNLCTEASVLVGLGAPLTALQIADSTVAKIAEERLKLFLRLAFGCCYFFCCFCLFGGCCINTSNPLSIPMSPSLERTVLIVYITVPNKGLFPLS